jgi:hypothetical protein
MSPAAVLDVYQSIKKQTPPPCFLLSIKAEKFELGEGLSSEAENNLDQACLFAEQLLKNPDIKVWQQQADLILRAQSMNQKSVRQNSIA